MKGYLCLVMLGDGWEGNERWEVERIAGFAGGVSIPELSEKKRKKERKKP